jgi:FkbM family methyltransferase
VTAVPWGNDVLCSGPFRSRFLVPVDDLSVAPDLALFGNYEPEFTGFLERVIQPGMTFVDVGANLGFFSVVAGCLGAEVIAYEPNPELFIYLERNLALNWIDAEPIPKAAHRDDVPRQLVVPARMKGCGSLVRFAGGAIGEERFQVECERLDDRIDQVDLLKVDVEGGEAAVLDGASKLVPEHVGVIALEYRDDVLPPAMRGEMQDALRSFDEMGATFHVPEDLRTIGIAEVLAVARYQLLLVRFPEARIGFEG